MNIVILGAALCLVSTAASAELALQPGEPAASEDIVITARRTGAPVWRVRENRSMLVLIGSIRDVAAGTAWRPDALQGTVRRADRVMFPGLTEVRASPIAMIGYMTRWRKQSRLPEGQSLRALIPPGAWQDLEQLRARGLAPADYDRWHPLHLAFKLQSGLRDSTRMAPDVGKVVTQAIAKHKIPRLPIARARPKPLANELFGSSPAAHVRCLADTLAMVRAGEEGLRQRSRDWASQRVQAVLASAAERPARSCWPATTEALERRDLLRTARQALAANGTTVAVIELHALGGPGALLDDLVAAGFKVEGPSWR